VKDIDFKTTKFLPILGVQNNSVKQDLVQITWRLQLYTIVAFPIPFHGTEIWTMKHKQTTSFGDEYFSTSSRYIPYSHKRSEEILVEIKMHSLD